VARERRGPGVPARVSPQKGRLAGQYDPVRKQRRGQNVLPGQHAAAVPKIRAQLGEEENHIYQSGKFHRPNFRALAPQALADVVRAC